MSSGFNSSLEGFEIRGNLTVVRDINDTTSSQNGSIEGSGSIYIDNIFNYTNNTGVNLEGSLFKGSSSTITNLFITNSTINNKAYFLNGIDNNSKLITNVTSPTNALDVANKYYVDLVASTFTTSGSGSGISGSFTGGQIIVANSTSGLSGFPSLTFNSTTGVMTLGTSASIIIYNTINGLSISSSNSLLTYGGITAQGQIWSNGLDVNSNKITNVTSPTVGLDGVNKYYVDSIISLASGDIQPERVFVLGNSVSIPTNITTFVFDNTVVSSFDAILYLSIPTLGIYDQYTMFGVLSGSTWILNYKSIGSANTNIKFSITNISSTGQVQYTNANASGVATVRFRATTTSQTNTISNLTFGNLIFKNVGQGGTGQSFFTQGTVLIGNGVNSINSYSNFEYINDTLFLKNTLNATSITSGPVLLSGGFSVAKNAFLNGIDNNSKLITNITSPTNSLDAANKYYVDTRKTPISAVASKISTTTYSRVLSWVYDPLKEYAISTVSFISNLSNSTSTDYYQSRLVNVSSNFILGVSNTLNNVDTPNTYTFTLLTSGVSAITSASVLEFQTYITTGSLNAYAYILSASLL
jgi:hypothetical protein